MQCKIIAPPSAACKAFDPIMTHYAAVSYRMGGRSHPEGSPEAPEAGAAAARAARVEAISRSWGTCLPVSGPCSAPPAPSACRISDMIHHSCLLAQHFFPKPFPYMCGADACAQCLQSRLHFSSAEKEVYEDGEQQILRLSTLAKAAISSDMP